MKRVETLVIGGGPAGAATACGLAALGREVMLLERAVGPHHKVCGEFLSIEAQAYLTQLGIEAEALGAVPVDRVYVHSRTRATSAVLPFRALSLSRFCLDEALLQLAADRGAELKRGVLALSATRHEPGWVVRTDAGESIECRRLVIATGKRALRGIEDSRDRSLVGLKMHFWPSAEAARALDRRLELFLLGEGYAGLQLVERGIANLCVAVPRSVAARLGQGLTGLHAYTSGASPTLAGRLKHATPLWDKPLAIVCPSGGHLHARAHGAESELYRVGDRFAHIPPFTGDGLAIALSSAALAVEHLRCGSASTYVAIARKCVAPAVRVARAVSWAIASRTGQTAFAKTIAWVPSLLPAIARFTRVPLPADA